MVNIMGLFGGKLDVGKIAQNALDKLDDSSLTQAEKAEGVISMMERLGITPSSKTRREVTWFLLMFMGFWLIVTAIAYKIDLEFGKSLLELFKEFTSSYVIMAIVGFFYGGYYVSKNISPSQKLKAKEKEQKLVIEKQEADMKLRKQEAEDQLDIDRKKSRHDRKYQRDRR